MDLLGVLGWLAPSFLPLVGILLFHSVKCYVGPLIQPQKLCKTESSQDFYVENYQRTLSKMYREDPYESHRVYGKGEHPLPLFETVLWG